LNSTFYCMFEVPLASTETRANTVCTTRVVSHTWHWCDDGKALCNYYSTNKLDVASQSDLCFVGAVFRFDNKCLTWL